MEPFRVLDRVNIKNNKIWITHYLKSCQPGPVLGTDFLCSSTHGKHKYMISIARRVLKIDSLFFLFAAYLVIKGYVRREDSFLTAESGVGYSLGIVGGSMMLILLLYPLRKHVRWLRSFGPVRYWFRIHMMLGVAGPVLVLYHANFGLGSANSNIALFCMLVVSGSGLFGRIFYSKIHDGLYGRKIELAELQSRVNELKQQLPHAEAIDVEIGAYEKAMLQPRPLYLAVFAMPFAHLRSRTFRKKMVRHLKKPTTAAERDMVRKLIGAIRNYVDLMQRVADFSVYERLFSLWHVLHIPLFFMMIISGIIHVIAVHIY